MKKAKKYLITGAVNIILLLAFAAFRGIFSAPDAEHVYHILSDDFFLFGVLNFGLGTLLWVGNEGNFDMLSYGFRQFWGFFFKGFNKYADFADYKAAKHSKDMEFKHFVIFGLVFIVIAYVFLKLYQQTA